MAVMPYRRWEIYFSNILIVCLKIMEILLLLNIMETSLDSETVNNESVGEHWINDDSEET